KGLPAAMLMSNLQAAVRSLASQALPPGEMVERLNRTMLQNSSGQKLITLFYAVIDVPNVTMSYVNAGHLPPLLVHGDGSYRQLSTGGAMLHIFADSTFEAAELRLMPGDRLLIFTDGVVECTNAAGDEFGEASLLQCLREGRADDAEGLLQRVKRSVTQFSGGEFQDDLTMLALGYGTVIFP
ncbi:MAG TPA: PP2C family protein-serine/threonine phosphatase, partial [Blastocatellia bacterium]|nr:PP2C family protein-serine/threonine phosphatase [Blastocatellia bacterium]